MVRKLYIITHDVDNITAIWCWSNMDGLQADKTSIRHINMSVRQYYTLLHLMLITSLLFGVGVIWMVYRLIKHQ